MRLTSGSNCHPKGLYAVKNEICNIWKKCATQLIFDFAILLVFFGSGCNTISPKLQDEYIRPGLSPGMCGVFDKYRQFFPEVMVKDKIPGISIALVDRDGILWAAGFGYTDYDRKTPVTTDTMFAICSISKTITATAVMVLDIEQIANMVSVVTGAFKS